MDPLKGPRGAPDIVPPVSKIFDRVVRVAEDAFSLYGFERIETPAFEHTEVFTRTLNASSDVVTKEMYTFSDRSDRSLTLRPEGTAPVMRAILEHNLHRQSLPVKLFYFSTSFRYERPQEGRQRAFHQVGVEAVGGAGPEIDAEVIELGMRVFRTLGLDVRLLVNSIGHPGCRAEYLPKLVAYLERNLDELCKDCQRKTQTNPLRTFDCKVPTDQKIMSNAPLLKDHLCDDCRVHFASLTEMLKEADILFEVEPKLVRGLDYYTKTTFTYVVDALGAQKEVGGGGRYDGLSELLGGPYLPGIGFGLGVDRITLALTKSGFTLAPDLVAFVIAASDDLRPMALRVATLIREAGLSADLDHASKSMKAQFRTADRLGARFVVVLGEREIDEGIYTIKRMQSGDEAQVPQNQLIEYLKGSE